MRSLNNKTVYLDHFASTPCDERVVHAMLPYFVEEFANPSSFTHAPGISALRTVESSREKIANALGMKSREIVFTGGATESNNLAILGLATKAIRRHIVTSNIEHKSVLGPIDHLERNGFRVTRLTVNSKGELDLDRYIEAIDDDTLLVSIQSANNEIGTIQDINTLVKIAHERGALFHCDAVQAFGKVRFDFSNVDLLSLSGHKIYGPKGIGLLALKGGPDKMAISSICFGGGQESGLRPGTLNVPLIVGFAYAAQLAIEQLDSIGTIEAIRDRFERMLVAMVPDVKLNGNPLNRLPGGSSITFDGIEAESLLANLPEFALSTGSACSGGAVTPSHVLEAIGLGRNESFGTLRVCFGRGNSMEDAERLAEKLVDSVHRIRKLNEILN